MKYIKLFEEIDEFHWENEEDMYNIIKNRFDEMLETEVNKIQDIRDFMQYFKEKVSLLSNEEKIELEKYFKENFKNIKLVQKIHLLRFNFCHPISCFMSAAYGVCI
jgi:hypothetical protein